MEGGGSTQLRRFDLRLRYDRKNLQTIFLCALVGSLTGALCARLAGCAILEGDGCPAARGSLPLSVLRLSLFPLMMTAALLLRRKWLFRLLFIGKGFAASYVLCVAAASGAGPLREILPGLLLETLLPLPGFFLLGALWYGQTREGAQRLWPLAPAFLPVLLGLLLERLAAF